MLTHPANATIAKWLTVGVVAISTYLSQSVAMANIIPHKPEPKIYIILWFDTEDYILPQSDDAAKRVAELLTRLGVRATFKVVGEKARTLERRGRLDVIEALKNHEIGYHSNTHSQHPTPAEYEEPLNWETGVTEFSRRERQGFEDVKRIFGQTPSCYGQPGSSWAPQSYGALKQWGVNVYLDESGQVGLDGKPFYYGGLLNIFNTREGGQLRANHDWSNLEDAKAKFKGYREKMTAEGGGIISIFFHPCEFIHGEFWDGVNFAKGANPPREEWKLPPMVSKEEQERKFKYLEDLAAYLKSFPDVQFITANEALKLYHDRTQGHSFAYPEIAEIAAKVSPDIGFQARGDLALSPADIFTLLTHFAAGVVRPPHHELAIGTTYGPASSAKSVARNDGSVTVPINQFERTVLDVADFLRRHHQIPNEVWLGSTPVTPESYLVALAGFVKSMASRREHPHTVTVLPAKLATARYVAEDSPKLWDWVIFPEGFHAPNLMALAKLQAWTLKPAILHADSVRSDKNQK